MKEYWESGGITNLDRNMNIVNYKKKRRSRKEEKFYR
jgi:hypothetical protein